MTRFRATIAALTIGIAAAISGPVAAENVLRRASVGGAHTFDPHALNSGPTIGQIRQVYERLVDLDSDLQIVPELALSWKPLNSTTWEFSLREGVRFHDGTPFTADDAAFSLERAKAATSQMAGYIASVAEAVAVDLLTLRVTTSFPDPLLPIELRMIPIMSRTWANAYDATVPASFKDDQENYATSHANGTGPFVLKEFQPSGPLIMVRNPDWWGFERYLQNIERIEYTPLTEPDERLTALLEGRLDLLVDPPFDALDRIEKTPGWRLEQTTQLRSIFLGLDQASPELRSSNVKGRNPFADPRVRRAMYHAIDAEAIRRDVMQGLSLPAGMIISPGVNGYTPEFDSRLPHDPELARRLLVDAGYPDGFDVALLCTINRYINDEAICHAVAEQLGQVGIRVTVDAQPHRIRTQRIQRRETDFWLQGWGFSTVDSLEVFLSFYHSQSRPFNASGYANPKVDELIERLQSTMITYARDAMIEEVWRIVLDEVVYLPLHHQMLVWAMREDLDLPINPLGFPLLREARFR